MTVSEFQDFLHFVDTKMNVTLLAYNSCFAGGRDGLSVYEREEKQLTFSFPIIMISLSDAPTYVFGTPSGFKLPPYSDYNQLTPADIKNRKLQPFFLQHFNDFFLYAHQKFCGPECMFLINHYKECAEDECDIFKIENMPLVRHPGVDRFMPLNEQTYFVMDDIIDDPVIIEEQKAVLWYQHLYKGTMYCIGSIPIFVSMLHQDTNIHTIREIIISTDIESFLHQAFVALEDHVSEIVWNIDRLIVQRRRGQKVYEHVHIKQNKHGVSWTY